MLPCFGSWNHKGEIAPLQGLQEGGKSRKKSFIRENSLICKLNVPEHLNLRLFQWMAVGLAWSGKLMRRQKKKTLKMVGVFYWQYQLNDV